MLAFELVIRLPGAVRAYLIIFQHISYKSYTIQLVLGVLVNFLRLGLFTLKFADNSLN